MDFLDEDKSWELFCLKAFGGEEDCPVELEEIGKKVVRRCRGLPLSIVVIGGHLRKSPREIAYWENLSNSISPISSLGRDDQCLEILRLSYHHLRKAEACAIHDVVRELCLKVAKKEKFIGVVEDTTGAKGCEERRMVVPAELSSARLHRASGLGLPVLLRSVICQGSWLIDELSVDFRLLRVSANVDMDKWKAVMHCPTPRIQRVNLRYLDFCVPYAKLPYCIPSSISLLWNLQTLTVWSGFGGGAEIIAPYEIWEVPQLRHLECDRLRLPDPLPSEEGSNQEEEVFILRNLHTLIVVVDLKLTEEVCKRIPNIKRLELSYRTLPEGDWEKEASSSYYCLHNLGRLNKLESLKCHFGQDSEWRDVFQSFTFPSSLVELTIVECHWEDLTKMIKSIPQLGYLELTYVSGSEWDLAEEEEFPHLRILKICYSHGLIRWNASSYNFPVLEKLHIYFGGESSKLREIPFDLGVIPTLRLIDLMGCSVSCALSAMRIVAEQENLGNQDLQLRLHFYKMKELERFQKMVGEEGLISDSLSVYHRGNKIKAFF